MPSKLVTQPAQEPITLAQFKEHARISRDDEDATIKGYIAAARLYAETRQRRQLITATWRLTLDGFPCAGVTYPYGCYTYGTEPDQFAIKVPRPPLQSVTSITYVDTDGVTQTLDDDLYRVDAESEPGRITPAYNQSWPYTRPQTNAVTVTFVAGYGATPATVPATTRQAIEMLAAHFYENREAILTGTIATPTPLAVESLLEAESWGGYR